MHPSGSAPLSYSLFRTFEGAVHREPISSIQCPLYIVLKVFYWQIDTNKPIPLEDNYVVWRLQISSSVLEDRRLLLVFYTAQEQGTRTSKHTRYFQLRKFPFCYSYLNNSLPHSDTKLMWALKIEFRAFFQTVFPARSFFFNSSHLKQFFSCAILRSVRFQTQPREAYESVLLWDRCHGEPRCTLMGSDGVLAALRWEAVSKLCTSIFLSNFSFGIECGIYGGPLESKTSTAQLASSF